MRIKATRSFSGLVTMAQGEERDVRLEIAEDLINAGYAESLEKKPDDKPEKQPEKKPEAKKEK